MQTSACCPAQLNLHNVATENRLQSTVAEYQLHWAAAASTSNIRIDCTSRGLLDSTGHASITSPNARHETHTLAPDGICISRLAQNQRCGDRIEVQARHLARGWAVHTDIVPPLRYSAQNGVTLPACSPSQQLLLTLMSKADSMEFQHTEANLICRMVWPEILRQRRGQDTKSKVPEGMRMLYCDSHLSNLLSSLLEGLWEGKFDDLQLSPLCIR